MSLSNSFRLFIKEHSDITQKKILIAVSGGIDSVVLAHLCYQENIDFGIAHCNFQLREQASEEDEAFVIGLAKTYNVPIFTKKFDVKAYVEQNKVSTQIAARVLRYEWFNTLLKQHQFDFIATAHHANDQLETILFNLTKGTGIKGIRGILPLANKVVRPLLHAPKGTIQAYAKENELAWREDSSNSSTKYQRNLIRHKVVPVLKSINPSLTANLHFTTERLRMVEQMLNAQLADFESKGVAEKSGVTSIFKISLKKQQAPLLILSEFLQVYGFNFKQAKQLFAEMDRQPGKIFKSHTHELLVDREALLIRPLMEQNLTESVKILAETKEIKVSHLTLKCNFEQLYSKEQLKRKNNILTVDASLISFPLTVRNWQEGDFFRPFGMKGKKKLSDFLTDQKLNLFEKQKVKVLCTKDDIVWVIGMRPDDRFKVSDNTRKIYTVEVI